MKGYVALTTILVLMPLLLLTGINVLYGNITNLSVSKMNYDHQILKTNSETCLEEVVYMIKRSPTFTGLYKIDREDWSCDIDVQDKVGSSAVKILVINATDINNTKLSVKRELDMNQNPFKLTNLE